MHTDSSFGFFNSAELDHAASFRPSTLKQNLSQLNLTSRLEELNQIFVRSRPGQLSRKISYAPEL